MSIRGNVLVAKYQVYRDVAGKFRFRLRAANNKIVAVSQAYERKAGCINGVKSVQNNCGAPIEDKTTGAETLPHPKYEVFADAASKYRFNLSASNGEIIAASEAYETKQNCLRGIEAMQKSCGADIEDLTLKQPLEKVTEALMAPVSGAADTNLMMDCPPTSVESKTIVTFKGKLTNTKTGHGIGKAKIDICERDRSFMSDDVLASGITDNDGKFKIEWKAYQQDWWDDSVEVYARFVGSENYNSSTTDVYRIRVLVHLKRKT
jgi:uncharacterized protein YegP (UPF0339 family)